MGSVQAFQKPFVCHTMQKVALKSRGRVSLSLGSHNVDAGPAEVVAAGFEIFHVPLRSREEISARGANRARIREAQPHPESSWQADHFADALMNDRIEDVWEANSPGRDGYLRVGSQKFATARDNRLRGRLFLALGYMLSRGLPFPLFSSHRRLAK